VYTSSAIAESAWHFLPERRLADAFLSFSLTLSAQSPELAG